MLTALSSYSVCCTGHRTLKLILKLCFFPSFKACFPSSKPVFRNSPYPPNLTYLRTMSAKRSAFDVLMSNASRKKNPPQQKQESPTKKTKTPESKPLGSQTTVQIPPKDPGSPGIREAQVEIPPKVEESAQKEARAGNKNKKDGTRVDLSAKVAESVEELKKKAAIFNPEKAAYWGKDEKVPFLFVARALDEISKETGRIVITEIVCNVLRTVIETTPNDLLAVVYLLANKIAPAHEGLELGIGDSSIVKALSEAYGSKEANIKKKYKELGDLGLVAKASRSSQSLMRIPEALTVTKVFDTFHLIAKDSGKDSQEKKKNRIKALLVAATDCEPQYLIRLLQGKLRIGLAEKTLLAALGHAVAYAQKQFSTRENVDSSLEEAAKVIKQVYSVIPVYDKIIPALLDGGVWNLPKTCNFSPGVPIGPMLAKPTKGVSEILDKFQDTVFTSEFKYDGERAQIHFLDNGSVEIYSRNAERNTGKFPDVIEIISRVKRASITSFVLDCELVAYDREKKKILPFQVLSTRARKNVSVSEIKVDVCIFAFDILHANGQPLLQEQLQKRREHLYNSFDEEPGYFQFAKQLTSDDLEEIQHFLQVAVDSSSEGLIIKTLNQDATYEPSKRSNNWLKLKKDYMDGIGDSLDLVPIAAFKGRGKRAGFYGAFLLACYDTGREEFQSVCKIGTGFTDPVLKERSLSLKSQVIKEPKSYYRCSENLKPDVWFEPTQVWEVKAADFTLSSVHCAATGTVEPDKGISLRFPRLLRVREDKKPEDATSSEMIADMYRAQSHNKTTVPSQKNRDDSEDE